MVQRAQVPQATFESSAIKALGGGKFEVAGKLTIKGNSGNVVAPVTLTQVGPVTTATGSFPIKRLAFKIGENGGQTPRWWPMTFKSSSLALTGVASSEPRHPTRRAFAFHNRFLNL